MADTLKVIYSQIFQAVSIKETPLIGAQEKTRWIPILLCWVPDKHIGISEDGFWVVEERSGLRILDSAKSLVRIKILLEKPIEKIRRELITYFCSSNIIEDVDDIFPFIKIIQGVLEDGFDYWMELAFKWYDEFPLERKIVLKNTLSKIVENKSVTQKLRHKARKELKRINEFTRQDIE